MGDIDLMGLSSQGDISCPCAVLFFGSYLDRFYFFGSLAFDIDDHAIGIDEAVRIEGHGFDALQDKPADDLGVI